MGSKAENTKPLQGISTGSPMEITLGQQYNVGEKLTVILYTFVVDYLTLTDRPPLYCRLTLISMQGHQNHNLFNLRVPGYSIVIWSYMVLGHLLWASYLGYIGIGSGNLGTSNPIRLFYGVVFGQIR